MMLSRREQNGGRYIVVPFFPIAFFAAKSVGAEVETIGRRSCARVAVVEKDFFFSLTAYLECSHYLLPRSSSSSKQPVSKLEKDNALPSS